MKDCHDCLNKIQGTVGPDLQFVGLAARKIVKLSGNIMVKRLAAEQFQRVLKIESYLNTKWEKTSK